MTEASVVAEPPAVGADSRPTGVDAWLVRYETHVSLVLLALLAWTAQFRFLGRLGLYEDDYWFVAQAMDRGPEYLLERSRVLVTWPQGRPLGFFLPDLFSFIGDKIGGLPGIYVVGFAIIVLNSFLCYRLFRLRMPQGVALAGAAAFGLFPADTTKILLTHDFQLQPSLTFLLLASLAYAYGRLPLAYGLSVGSLLCYENAFVPFLAVPLLVLPWNRELPRRLALHVLIVIGVLAAIVVVRLALGEERAAGSASNLAELVPKALGSLVIGPSRALAAFGYGPLRFLPTWDLETMALAALVGIGSAAALVVVQRRGRRDVERWRILQVLVAGGVLLVLGYALAFTHYPPVALTGRGTSVHLGATLGASVLFAAGVWLLQSLLRPAVAAALVGAYLTLAAGYSMTIARDFEGVWQTQRAFWHEVVACCSDLQDGTVLIYEWDGAVSGQFIFDNSWADPLILERTFRFPREWSTPPRLFSLTSWHERVTATSDGLQWRVPEAVWYEYQAPLPQSNVILLRRQDGRLVRHTGAVDVGGGTLALKPPGPTATFAPGPLWRYFAAP